MIFLYHISLIYLFILGLLGRVLLPVFICCASLGNRSWCDHWKQSIWFIPKSSSLPVFRDEEVHLQAFHTETSISYELKASYDKQEVSQDCQIVLSPERYALYGDRNWRHLMLNAIGKAVSLSHL